MTHGPVPDRGDAKLEATFREVKRLPFARRQHLRGAGTVLISGWLGGGPRTEGDIEVDEDASSEPDDPSSDP